MAERDIAVSVTGLTKSYGSFEALRGIDFAVQRGEVLALLGPNGAGKTTAVEILEGYRKRDGGNVRVLGSDPERRDRGLRTKGTAERPGSASSAESVCMRRPGRYTW